MRIEPHPCFLLHRRPWRESGALLEVLSCEHGRSGLIARGLGGRSRSGWGAELQPFRPLRLAWSRRGELGTLAQVESDGRPTAVPPARIPSAFYLNELLLRLLQRDDPCPELFLAYAEALRGLLSGAPEQALLRVFEKRLLEGLGYGLSLSHAIDTGRPIEPGRLYHYLPGDGALEQPPETPGALCLQGASLQALADEHFVSAETLRESRALLRLLLGQLLGERPLASRRLCQPL